MNTDNYNKALDQLAFYWRRAVLAETGTPTHTRYVYDKGFDELYRDVCEAYDS